SYGTGIIKQNIFGWFTGAYETYKYSDLASRGLFNSANQISALLVLLLPIMFIIYTYQQNIKNLLIIILALISMIMLGTKVALYGAIISIIIYFFALIFMTIIMKQKLISKKIFVALGISVLVITGLYEVSPVINRPSLEENYANKEEFIQIDLLKEYQKNNEDDKVIEFIKNNYKDAKIKDEFILGCYPYQYDPEFWIEVFEMPLIKRRDWRLLELKMHQRVMDINDNTNDKWLGISFTRSEHLFTLERDFVSQYYSMGILGVILLLGPYVLITLACFIKMLIQFREKFNLRNSIRCFAIVFILGSSINSGNIMDCLTITIILGFIIGKLTEDIFMK
ncbi:MAG: O-antigen ligase family protein, partial [Terrisporobacter sp.]